MGMGTLETFKTYSDIASNVTTVAAIVIGAIWSYRAFFRERVRWPKATVELVMSHRELSPEWTLLHVKVKVHNTGKGLMKLTSLRVDVFQVLPLLDDTRKQLEDGKLKPPGEVLAEWHPHQQGMSRWGKPDGKGCEPELEPDENEEFGNDFLVPSTLETVYVYVYIANEAKRRRRDLGWTVTNYYDLKGKSGGESAVNLIAGESTMSVVAKEAP
jgi:hypothetical protein